MSLPAATEWCRLLLDDVICSVRRMLRLTMYCQWPGRSSFPSFVSVTLTFDRDVQTRKKNKKNHKQRLKQNLTCVR